MTRTRRIFAVVLAALLAVAGLGTLSISTAQAFSGMRAVPCHLYFGSGLPGSPASDPSLALNNSTFVMTGLSVSATSQVAGQVIGVTMTSTGGLTNGPVALAAGALSMSATIVLTGGKTGTVSLVQASSYPAAPVAAYGNLGPLTMTGTYVAAGNTTTTLAFRSLRVFDTSGSGANNFCDGTDAGTTMIPAGIAANFPTNGTTYQSTNYNGPAGSSGFSTTGFKVTRIAAGPTLEWVVPATWSPYSGPVAPPSTPNYGDVTVAGSPATSTFITQLTIVAGPNAAISTSSGQNAGVQAARFGNFTTIVNLTGTNWTASQPIGSFTAVFCDLTGVSCVNPGYVDTNALQTNINGDVSGYILHSAGTGPTTGNRAIKLTQGAKVVLVPVLVLADPTITTSPASGGAGILVTTSGSSFNPGQSISLRSISTPGSPYTATTDPATNVTASAIGGMPSTTYTINASTTVAMAAEQGSGPFTAAHVIATSPFQIFRDSCTAYSGNTNLPSPSSCTTDQGVFATVLNGSLSQSAAQYAGNPSSTVIVFCTTAAPLTPPGGTQPGNTTACGLGSPLTTSSMFGTLNPITVTDNRGGTYGWTLTATLPNLSDGAHTLTAPHVTITPAIDAGTAGSAPGATAGAASAFGGTVTLATKSTAVAPYPGSQTAGGQWVVSGGLVLTVPAFQAAGQYSSTMTVNLS